MQCTLARFSGVFFLLALLVPAVGQPMSRASWPAGLLEPPRTSAGSTASAEVDTDWGRMPVYFIQNDGQLDSRVAYYVQGRDKTLYFASDSVTFALTQPARPQAGSRHEGRPGLPPNLLRESPQPTRDRWIVRLDFLGANPGAKLVAEDQQETVVSYFKGSPDEWHTSLPTYARLVYRDLWPGIDLAYQGTVDRLKYQFLVHPGADPSQIRLAYRGARNVTLNDAGQLEIATPLGSFTDDAPAAYQDVAGQRARVHAGYRVFPAAYRFPGRDSLTVSSSLVTPMLIFGFEVGPYDPSRLLTLDPAILIHCGYIGGSDNDYAAAVDVDGVGSTYVIGRTYSVESQGFPVMTGPDLTYNGDLDVFVAKVLPDGSGLAYCGYIGGTGRDYAGEIAVDDAGHAYVTGFTTSSEASFPVAVGPDTTYNGGDMDAFVAKVKADGSGLVYCGYIGGARYEESTGMAVDEAGNAYITGWTNSAETEGFPVLVGPDLTYNHPCGCGWPDAFVAKIKPDGTGLAYCGYIGGSDHDWGSGVDVDGAGHAYVVGFTDSSETSFPVAAGPDLAYNGGLDGFVTKVKADGTGLAYCGYVGGSGDDSAENVAVDDAGFAYIVGETNSSESTFPVVIGPDLTYNGGSGSGDAFIAKVHSSGTALDYCGYVGGSADELGSGIAVGAAGNAYVAGSTASSETTFPVAVGPDLTFNGGGWDGFVSEVCADGTGLVYSGYVGGDSYDGISGVAVDGIGNAYVAGTTGSTDATFPVAAGPDTTYNGGGYDSFAARVGAQGPFSIAGHVHDASGAPISDTLVSAGEGGSATTDSLGIYTLPGLVAGAYTVTPNKIGCTFAPPARTVSVPPNAGEQDFVEQCMFNVSGRVHDENWTPFADVAISADNGDGAVTGADGVYTVADLPAGSYTLIAALSGYSFWPAARTVDLPPDATGQDFIILPGPTSITLTPGVAASLVYTDTQGLPSQLDFPASAVTQTTMITLTPTVVWGAGGFASANHAFEMTAYREDSPLPGLEFAAPVTVTIRYSNADIRLVTDESQLALWWADDGWQDAAQTCDPISAYLRDDVNNVLSLPICLTSRLGLFGPTHQILLPAVFRRYP